ncbi:MAG: alkaline phosphatase D family protein [Planctomycetes bacterium]|nr:alkaline phosphatase D family protein [Planctomycetota bacterium]
MVGGVRSDGARIWARSSKPGRFNVVYGPEKEDEWDRMEIVTSLERDNTGWVELVGLKSDTKYYYELELPGADDATGKGGWFRTLPTEDDFRDSKYNPDGLFNFSFEFACGNSPRDNSVDGTLRPAFMTMLPRLLGRINFAILNGDWLYEKKREYPADQWRDQVGITKKQTPEIVSLCPSIVGVWENYKDYLDNDAALRMWHGHIPTFFNFDDHEILGDVNGAGTIGFKNQKAVFRDIGTRAWRDYLGWSNPQSFEQDTHFGRGKFRAGSDILTDREADFSAMDLDQTANLHVHWGGQLAGTRGSIAGDGDENAGVYEIVEILDKHRLRISPAAKATKSSPYSVGRLWFFNMRVSNCEFFFLDTRSFRQLHDIKDPFKPDISMIGQKQKAWLKKGMGKSDADFLFVVSTINLMIPHVSPGAKTSNKDEAWTSFLTEREDLIDFWDGLGKPVFILTGDLHNSMAIKITDRVWEFASGPHSSTNHSADAEGGRPPNGVFKHGPRACEIRWSSYVLPELGRNELPHYCVVQVNNVFSNTDRSGEKRWVAFPRPQVIFQYFDGLTGQIRYAESILAPGKPKR